MVGGGDTSRRLSRSSSSALIKLARPNMSTNPPIHTLLQLPLLSPKNIISAIPRHTIMIPLSRRPFDRLALTDGNCFRSLRRNQPFLNHRHVLPMAQLPGPRLHPNRVKRDGKTTQYRKEPQPQAEQVIHMSSSEGIRPDVRDICFRRGKYALPETNNADPQSNKPAA